ncbi:MAG: hypothetical protein ABI480_10535, partial [Chitinophagaceae bacterium]
MLIAPTVLHCAAQVNTVTGNDRSRDDLQKTIDCVCSFYIAAIADKRIGTTHISLFMALLYLWYHCDLQIPLLVTRQMVMPVAGIRGRATYHKCIKELEEFGYIKYE